MIATPTLLSIAALSAWQPAATSAAAGDRRCFDVAAIASLERYEPTDIEEVRRELGGDAIVIRWPWLVDIDIDKVILGVEPRRNLRVTLTLHNALRRDIAHVLLLMRRTRDGGYVVVDYDPYIARDHHRRWVRPVEGPEAAGMLADWADGDFTRWLRPVSFAAARVWWNDRKRTDALAGIAGASGWSAVSRGRLVARRAFHLSDLEDMIGPTAPCPPSSEP